MITIYVVGREAGPSGAIPRNGSLGFDEEEKENGIRSRSTREMRMIPSPSFMFCQANMR